MKKLQKNILKILKSKEYPIDQKEIKNILISEYGYKDEVKNLINIFSSKVYHQISVMEGDNLLKKEKGIHGRGMIPGTFVSLTSLGYKKFDPFYKKLWSFFTTDMAKILSIIATVLSIIAMYQSIIK